DRELLARILAKSPGRKRGRPPIGDSAMTDAERKRRERNKTLPPQERVEPGAVVPVLPLRPAASGISMIEEITRMVANLLDHDLAERYHQYLGEVLDRLADVPPDYILTRHEFTVVAAAAAMADRLLPKELH